LTYIKNFLGSSPPGFLIKSLNDPSGVLAAEDGGGIVWAGLAVEDGGGIDWAGLAVEDGGGIVWTGLASEDGVGID
jgi:hypothetical protein